MAVMSNGGDDNTTSGGNTAHVHSCKRTLGILRVKRETIGA